MAIGTPVEVGSGQWTTGSTIPITLTANVPAGSTLILFSNVLGALAVQTPVSSVADAASNPWAVGLNKGQGTGPEDTDIWFGRMNTGLSSGGTVTVTYGGVGGLGQGIASLAYVTGLDTTSPLDKAVGAVGSSTAPSSGTSGTLSQANEICIGVVGRYNAASTVTLTSIGSFTAMTKQQNSAGTTRCTVWPAYQIVSATTAQTYSGTLSVTGAWEAIQITLKGAATAATPPPPQGVFRRLARLPWVRRPAWSQTPPRLAAQPPPGTRRRAPQLGIRLRRRSASPPVLAAPVVVTVQLPPPVTRRRLRWPTPRRQALVLPPPSSASGALLPRQSARRRMFPALRRAARPSQLVPPQAIRGFIPAYFYPTLGEWAILTTFPNQPAVMIANPASGPGTSVNSDYTTWIGTAVHSGIQILGYVNLQYATRTLGTPSDTASSGTVYGDINGWLTFYPNITGIFFDLSPTDAGANLTFTQSATSYARSVLPNGAPVWINPGAYPLVSDYIDAADVALVYENNYQAGYQGFTIPSWAAGYVPNYPPTKFAHLLYNVPTAQAERVALGIAARNRVGWFFATNSDDTFSTLAPYWASDERFDLWTLNTAVDDPIARLTSSRRRSGWVRRQPRPGQPVLAQTVVVTVQALPPQSTRQARALVPRRRSRGAQPVPPPVTVTAQALPPQPARRAARFTGRPRARAAQPVPAQVVVVTVQALPPQPTRKARTWFPRRRPQTGQPVPAQTPALTTQALPLQPGRRAPRFSFRARPRNAGPPVQVTVTVPPQPGRRPSRQSVVGHRRGTQLVPTPVVVTVQSLPPQPTRRPNRFLPRARPRVTAAPVRITVTVVSQAARRSPWISRRRRPRAGQPVPPQTIVVTAQTFPAQASRRFRWLPLRRHNRAGQFIPVHVTVIVTPTPPERTYVVPGERRTYVVPTESRAVTVPAESRTVAVPAESRATTVPIDPRSTTTRR